MAFTLRSIGAALTVVKPTRWSDGIRKSCSGGGNTVVKRPLAHDARRLIGEMAAAMKPGRGKGASELPKPGFACRRDGPALHAHRVALAPDGTFVRNHASAMRDFFVAIGLVPRHLRLRGIEVGTRRIRHWNVTEHPTAD